MSSLGPCFRSSYLGSRIDRCVNLMLFYQQKTNPLYSSDNVRPSSPNFPPDSAAVADTQEQEDYLERLLFTMTARL